MGTYSITHSAATVVLLSKQNNSSLRGQHGHVVQYAVLKTSKVFVPNAIYRLYRHRKGISHIRQSVLKGLCQDEATVLF